MTGNSPREDPGVSPHPEYVPYSYGTPDPTLPGSADPGFQRYSYTGPPNPAQDQQYRSREGKATYLSTGRKLVKWAWIVPLAVLVGIWLMQAVLFACSRHQGPTQVQITHSSTTGPTHRA